MKIGIRHVCSSERFTMGCSSPRGESDIRSLLKRDGIVEHSKKNAAIIRCLWMELWFPGSVFL